MPMEASELTRPNTGSSFYSGVTSPGGSSEDEFFDAPESLGNHGQTRTESPSEPRISTPLVATNMTPTLQPIDSPIFPVLLEPPLNNQPTLPSNFLLERPYPIPQPVKDEFSSLDSTQSASETETLTAVPRTAVSPLMETEEVLTQETAIPGFNGGTTNILTFLSPNPDSVNKEFTFTLIKPSTPDLPPLPESELLDETLRNGLLTPDFPPPPSPLSTDGLLPPNQLTTDSRMEPVIPTNPQKLYPELDMSFPPHWGQQELPLSPLTPQEDPLGVQTLPQMERNPLYVPEQPPSCLLSDLMLLGSVPPGLVMNPLTQQLILAQQALTQQFSANIPQVPFPHQVQPNNIMPANFMTGFQNFSPHNFNNMSAPFGNFNEGQFDSNENWNNEDDDSEWRRDLMLKEKRILRDKYGDNHMNILTDRPTNKPTRHLQTDPQGTENMSPLVPNLPEPEKCDSSVQWETQPQEFHTDDTQLDRICYPSLQLNSSDEEPSNVPQTIKDNETKILPAFLSRMKNSNTNQSNTVPPPPHDTSYTTLFNNRNIPTQTSTETHETQYLNEQQTNQYNKQQIPPRDLFLPTLPIYYPPSSEITWTPNKSILYPPEHRPNPVPTAPLSRHPREIKRPPLDTSPSPLKPCKREISYPPGLEPSTSPKKQIIFYPPSEHKRIRYPPHKDILRPPGSTFFLNKSSSFHFNNESSFTDDKEIIYPHSWTEALSPRSSPVREIHYPPRGPVQSDSSLREHIPEIPDIPKETAADITPPIQDSSDTEEVPGTRSPPLESTPIKKSLISSTEDRPDLDSDLGGFETPTEMD